MSYPVVLEVERPEQLEAGHVLLRLAIVALFLVTVAFIWLVSLIYVMVPVLAALLISRDGPEGYMRTSSGRLLRWIHWLVAFDAYITLLVDRLPGEKPPPDVQLHVSRSGLPGAGSALMRLVYSLPSALVLAALGIPAVFTWIPAAALIVERGRYPEALYRFHRGVVGWGARLLAFPIGHRRRRSYARGVQAPTRLPFFRAHRAPPEFALDEEHSFDSIVDQDCVHSFIA